MEKIRETSYYHTRIKDWPEEERPREKLLQFGSEGLSDAELLAILIGSGTGGVTALDIAKRLLVEHLNLAELSACNCSELIRYKGIGNAGASRLMASFEIGRRIEKKGGGRRIKINSPEDVIGYYLPVLRNLKKEVFKVILLDSGNKIIRDVTISQGILNASLVHPREVFKAAVDFLAAGIILLHNHPSGEPLPSSDDRKMTSQLVKAGEIVGIPILDHLILAGDRHFSFAERGLLS